LGEHFPLPESERKAVLLTRNRHGRLVERFLLGRHHDNYHLVHHLHAGIPCWNMKRAHRELMADAGYAEWDSMWAGVLTRTRREKGRDTVLSYASAYRAWRRAGADQAVLTETTFAEARLRARRAAA
jgi:fatty acid desaturase